MECLQLDMNRVVMSGLVKQVITSIWLLHSLEVSNTPIKFHLQSNFGDGIPLLLL
jgi:hypothetical protein